MFDRYKYSDNGYIVMANSSKSKIINIGTINMKIFDRVILTLGNVRHIPNLRKNFVSLNRLDALDNDFSTRNEFMKVGKGSLVIIKRKSKNNLFKFIRDPIWRGITSGFKDKINVGEKLNLKSYKNNSKYEIRKKS